MSDIRIRSIDIASHKLDNDEPPNYGAMNVEIGGMEMRLFLKQEHVDALITAAEPIAADVVRSLRDVTLTGRVVAA